MDDPLVATPTPIATRSRLPELAELPAPPESRTGWPWDEATPLPGEAEPRAEAWPQITVVMPVFNDAAYVEEAIRSVVLQHYPNLEFVVVDGDSTDESVEVIRRYEPWLSDWVSLAGHEEPQAINRGLTAAKGEIYTWLAGRDLLQPGALYQVAQVLGGEHGPELLLAPHRHVDADGEALPSAAPWLSHTQSASGGSPRVNERNRRPFAEMKETLDAAVFARSSLWSRAGPLAEGLTYAYTAEWILRARAQHAERASAPDMPPLASYRRAGEARSTAVWWRIHLELARSYLRFAGSTGSRARQGLTYLQRAWHHAYAGCLLASDERYALGERFASLGYATVAYLLGLRPLNPQASSRLRRALSRPFRPRTYGSSRESKSTDPRT